MQGLTEQEAKNRLRQDGENVLAEAQKPKPVRIFLGQFRDVMVMILLAATAVSILLGELTDAITIILIVLLNAILGFLQEYRTEKTLETLRQMTAPTAAVCRDGKWQTISAAEIVRGDLIRLEAGDRVPADAALLTASGVAANESVLTGESAAVSKTAGAPEDTDNALHKKNIVYAGTTILRGTATACVIATGIRTQMGQISDLLHDIETPQTPLQKRLAGLGKVVALLCIAVCILVFAAGVLRGEPIFDMLMTGITIAIAAIPEGLPATVTIALALAVSRMMKHQALVNRLHSVETLGCAGVLCADKTGTITENHMTVTDIITSDAHFSVDNCIRLHGTAIRADSSPALKNLLECCVLCTTAEHTAGHDPVGDPTETALLLAAEKGGLTRERCKQRYPLHKIVPFDSETKKMCVTVAYDGGERQYIKGAADRILPDCTQLLHGTNILSLTESYRREVTEAVNALSERALRVLAFAYRDGEDGELVFLGLSGMLDPPRESAKQAIHTCELAKIQTVMITGDHKKTALAIAEQAGLLHGKKAMTGKELDALSDDQLAACIQEYAVFARVNPAHKLRLVRAYQKRGAIVAMTGDGVNDAPALKEADVGVAMGKSGTEVAKQAADVVLLDDNLSTLVYAVEQGRCIYANIRKFVRYLLSCNIGEVITMLLGILMGMPVILLPTQLLLVNLVTDGLPAIALGMEQPEPDAMRQPPRKPEEPFFSGGLLQRIVFRGLLIGVCTLGAFSTALRLGGTLEMARTTALCTLILSQLIHVFECKSETKSLFSIPIWNNWKLLVSVLFSAGILLAAVQSPALQMIFTTVPLSLPFWLTVIGFSFAIPIFSAVLFQMTARRRG